MTIATTTSRNDYTGDASTRVFAYTFKILASGDLAVYLAGTLQVSGYTVSGAGAASGGSVTFTTAPASAVLVSLVREVPYTQATDYIENDAFPANVHEDALDKVTMLIQQVKELATRAMRFAAGDPNADTGVVMPALVASKYLQVNSDCTGFNLVALLTTSGIYVDPVTTKGDLIVGGTTGAQERLPIATVNGSVLYLDPDTGRPGWKPGLAVSLRNKADAAVGAGCVLMLSITCARAVQINDVRGCTGIFVVAPAAIGDDCEALWTVSGVARDVAAVGAITCGLYLRKSATAKALESTGVTMGAESAPIGTLGVALSERSNNAVDAYLFGSTVTSRVQGTCGTFAKFTSSCEVSASAFTEHDNDVESTLPLIVPSASGITPIQHGFYREAMPKAWVVFDGTNATATGDDVDSSNQITPLVSFNITSTVTKLATGEYCVSFQRVFSCARYLLIGGGTEVSSQSTVASPILAEMNAGCCRFVLTTGAGARANPTLVSVAFFGTQ